MFGDNQVQLNNTTLYGRTRKDHVLNNEPIKLKKEYCEMCYSKFSLMKIKISHNCKRCFRTVCDNCGAQREKIIGCLERSNEVHRICNICKEERIAIQHFCKQNYLKWGHSSKIGERWMQSLGITQSKQELMAEYTQIKSQISDQLMKSTPEIDIIKKDLQGFNAYAVSFNYSFCEFLAIMQKDVSNKDVQQELLNILVRFLFKNPEVGYTKEYIRLLSFIMCFCTQQEAFFIFSYIFYYAIPTPLYPREVQKSKMETVEQYIKYISDDFLHQKVFEDKDILLIKQYLSGSFFTYYQSLFVNCLPVLVTFSIMDSIISNREYNVIEKYTKALCFMHLRNMRQVGSNTDQLNEIILRNTTKISDLQTIISQNFKGGHLIYSLDLLDKQNGFLQNKLMILWFFREVFSSIQAQSKSQDLQSQIESLRSSLETMSEYSNSLHDELQRKNVEIDDFKQQIGQKKRQDEQEEEYNKLISSQKMRISELDLANKNLKVEVFNQSLENIRNNKKYEEDVAVLNQKLASTIELLKQESIKVQKGNQDNNSLRQKASEENKQLLELLNKEKLKSQQMGVILQQQKQQLQLNAENKNNINSPLAKCKNELNSSPNGSPQNQVNNQEIEEKFKAIQAQVQEMQATISQQKNQIEQMRAKGQQMTIVYNQLRDNFAKEVGEKNKLLQQNGTLQQQISDLENVKSLLEQSKLKWELSEKNNSEEYDKKFNHFREETEKKRQIAIEEAIRQERDRNQQIIAQMRENIDSLKKKHQEEMNEIQLKIDDTNKKLQVSQKQVEHLLNEGKKQEEETTSLFELQLGQKQTSINQKMDIIRSYENEANSLREQINELKSLNQSEVKEKEKLQLRIQELELSIQDKKEQIEVLQQEILKRREFEDEQTSESENKERQNEIRDRVINEKIRIAEEREKILNDKEFQIKQREIDLDEREASLNQKEKSLIQREKKINEQELKLADTEERQQQLASLQTQKMNQLQERENHLEQREAQLSKNQKILEEEQHKVYEKEIALIERLEDIENRENKLNEEEGIIRTQESQLRIKEQEVESKSYQLKEFENRLEEKDQELKNREESILAKEIEMENKLKQLNLNQIAYQKDKEKIKNRELEQNAKQKELQELKTYLNSHQEELERERKKIEIEREDKSGKEGDQMKILLREQAQHNSNNLKDIGEVLKKMKGKLETIQIKMKQDQEQVSMQLGIDLHQIQNDENDAENINISNEQIVQEEVF